MNQWLVVKYVPDLRRREPRNVGLILFSGDEVFARFKGETTPGEINGHRVRGFFASLENYRSWVTYWRALTEAGAGPDAFLKSRPDDSFVVEPGGRVLVDFEEASSPRDLLRELYGLLVEEPQEQDRQEFRDTVDDLLLTAGLSDDRHLRRDVLWSADTGEKYEFPYVWQNGHTVVGTRLASFRTDFAQAMLWEFRNIDQSIGKVVFTRDVLSESHDRTAELLEEQAHVLTVGSATPDDVRAAFELAAT